MTRCIHLPRRPHSARSRRHGSILVEALMAVVIATSVIVGATQLLLVAANQRRSAEQWLLATREAGNLMEDLMTRSWMELSAPAQREPELSPLCRERLPEAQAQIEVFPEVDSERVLRISVEIQWRSGMRAHRETVRLVAWRYRPAEAMP